MPSTDIDGSPITIIGREQAILILRMAHRSPVELNPNERALVERLQRDFGLTTEEDDRPQVRR